MSSIQKKVFFIFLGIVIWLSQITIAHAKKTEYREFPITLVLTKPVENSNKLSDNLLELVKPISVENQKNCKKSVLLPSNVTIKRLDTGNSNPIELGHKKIEESYYAKNTDWKTKASRFAGQNIEFKGFSDEMLSILKSSDYSVLSEKSSPSLSMNTEWDNFLKSINADDKKLIIAPKVEQPKTDTVKAIIAKDGKDYEKQLTELLCASDEPPAIELYVLTDSIVEKQAEPINKTPAPEPPKPSPQPIVQPHSDPAPVASSANQDLYAVIEIGSSGIKPAVLQMIYSHENDLYQINPKGGEDIKDKKSQISELIANDANAFHSDAIQHIAEDLKGYIEKFQRDYAVPKEHIYIVGSSGVALVSHKDELQHAVQDATGIKMEFITAEQEGKLVFEGSLKQIPRERDQRDRREEQAVVIDIGSGNTKGAYFDTSTNRIATFEIKYGTKTFSKKVDEEKGNNLPFADKAKELREHELRPAIRKEAERVVGLENKPRVYLIGGIPWATSTLLSLDAPKYESRSTTGDQAIYTVMNFDGISDVDRLYNRVTGAKAAEQVCENNADVNLFADSDKKQKRLKEISDICTGKFTMEQLTGGLEIMKALALELKFKDRKVFFIQGVLHAWSVGYLKEKIEQNSAH